MTLTSTSHVSRACARQTSDSCETPCLFVLGNARSGTTMMARILGAHPRVLTASELHFFEKLWMPGQRGRPISDPQALQLIARLCAIARDGFYYHGPVRDYVTEARHILAHADIRPRTRLAAFACFLRNRPRLEHPPRDLMCDHTPENAFYIGEILNSFPAAQVVVMVRDPRDVLCSQKYRWKVTARHRQGHWRHIVLRTWLNYHPITTSRLWCANVTSTLRVQDDPRVCRVRYEDLVADPEPEIRRVCRAVGLDFRPAMLAATGSTSSNEPVSDTPAGIDPTRSGKWRERLSAAEVAICQTICAPLMHELGYAVEPTAAGVMPRAALTLSAPLKLAAAAALHLPHRRGWLTALRRRLVRMPTATFPGS